MAKYRLIGDGWAYFEKGKGYDENHTHPGTGYSVSEYARRCPKEWELVEEPTPYIKTYGTPTYTLKLLKPSDLPLKGEIADFPVGVVEKMLEKQVEQGNIADVSIFESLIHSDRQQKGFSWDKTTEGDAFWNNVSSNTRFEVFFAKYPEYENAVFSYDAVHPETNKLINEKLMQYPVTPSQAYLPDHFVVKAGEKTYSDAKKELITLGYEGNNSGSDATKNVFIRIKNKVIMGYLTYPYTESNSSKDHHGLREFTLNEVIAYHNSKSNSIQPFKQQQNVNNQITGNTVVFRLSQPEFRRQKITGKPACAQTQAITITSRQIEHRARARKA